MKLEIPFLNSRSLEAMGDGLRLWFIRGVECILGTHAVGSLRLWPDGVAAPRFYLVADGSTVNTEEYAELGVLYGASGSTFALPNPASPPTGFVWIVAV